MKQTLAKFFQALETVGDFVHSCHIAVQLFVDCNLRIVDPFEADLLVGALFI